MLNDQFNSGGLPSHWLRYDGPYSSDPHTCATPKHAFVSKGLMRMVFRYRWAGKLWQRLVLRGDGALQAV